MEKYYWDTKQQTKEPMGKIQFGINFIRWQSNNLLPSFSSTPETEWELAFISATFDNSPIYVVGTGTRLDMYSRATNSIENPWLRIRSYCWLPTIRFMFHKQMQTELGRRIKWWMREERQQVIHTFKVESLLLLLHKNNNVHCSHIVCTLNIVCAAN